MNISERIREGGRTVGRTARQVVGSEMVGLALKQVETAVANPQVQRELGSALGRVLSRSEHAARVLSASREARLRTQRHSQTVFRAVREVVVTSETPLGQYNVADDGTHLAEAVVGRTLEGRRMDIIERIVQVVAAVIPGRPAHEIMDVFNRVREAVEEGAQQASTKRNKPEQNLDRMS